MRQLSLVVAVAVVGLAACKTDSSVQPNQPVLNALISDGAHLDASGNGNKDFFFLPPLVPSPVNTPFFDAGKFNPKLSPTAEVCELDATDLVSLATANCKSATVRVFGPVNMTLDASNEQYQLNWDTKASLLNALSFYRIIIRGAAKGTVLGTLDVDPVLGGMKNARSGDVYVFQDGRTLPIKVRVEQGAFGSSNSSDRVEQVVPAVLPSTGLDVTTNTGFAGAHFSNGWLPDGFDQVVVIIERTSPNCLNTPLEQLEGCYRFRTDPDLHGLGINGADLLFPIPVVAGVCFQYPGDIGQHNEHPFQLMRSEEITIENEVRVTPAVPLLDERPAPFLHCDGFGATPPSIGAAFRSGAIGDIAKAGLYAVTHALGRVLEPKSLHAVDFGAGGSTNEFSRFGYAREATMTVTAGDGATAPAGTTIAATVRVQSRHHGDSSAVANQSVTFTVPEGQAGTITAGACSEAKSCVVATDGSGYATVTWRLAEGTNTLSVSTDQVSNSPQTIAATGTAVALPDLSMSNLSIDPANPTSGQVVTMSATITNSGGSTASGETITLCAVQFTEGGGSGGTCGIVEGPTLEPHTSAIVTQQLGPFNAGTWTLSANADTFNVVHESDETNNVTVGPEFDVSGPPVIDGNLSPGEWTGAAVTTFPINLPEGGTTDATLYIKNDGTNLYLALSFPRAVADNGNALNFEFDNNNSGTGPQLGDDYITFTPQTGFGDAFRSTCQAVPASCVENDHTDGVGAFFNNRIHTVYEMSHPLNSGEEGKDFALVPPTTLGFLLQLDVGSAHTRYPAGPFPTYAQLDITAP